MSSKKLDDAKPPVFMEVNETDWLFLIRPHNSHEEASNSIIMGAGLRCKMIIADDLSSPI